MSAAGGGGRASTRPRSLPVVFCWGCSQVPCRWGYVPKISTRNPSGTPQEATAQVRAAQLPPAPAAPVCSMHWDSPQQWEKGQQRPGARRHHVLKEGAQSRGL